MLETRVSSMLNRNSESAEVRMRLEGRVSNSLRASAAARQKSRRELRLFGEILEQAASSEGKVA